MFLVKMAFRTVLTFLFFLPFVLEAHLNELVEALEMAEYWDVKNAETFPVTYNHILSTGYFTTPSARMSPEGEIGLGVAHVPPYLIWNGRIQPLRQLEFTANYRIFKGVEDSNLSPHGFGDYADRGANFKYALITPEDTSFQLPGIAFGVEDFMGSKKFTTYFVAATQVWPRYGLEATIGWGAGRFTNGPSRGFYGACNWFPFCKCPNKWFEGICLSAEYDPTNYSDPEREPHPDGRTTSFPINAGIKYQLQGLLEVSGSYIRGEEFAVAGSLQYNFGSFEGFLPKIGDPVPYANPVNNEPLGCYRPEAVMIQNLNYALEEQGFQLIDAYICGARLWLSVMNGRYRQEHVVRMRLQHLFAALLPANIECVTAVIESFGLPCQQYTYSHEVLLRYANHTISPHEFDALTPRMEAQPPNHNAKQIFHRRYDLWRGRISPRLENFFGSTKGKYKYDFGFKGSLEGFLPYSWFYQMQASFTALSSIHGLGDVDRCNPSQLPIVGTDYIRYRQQSAFTWDKLYMQKSWNMTHGMFGRVSGGYFQVNYGGVAGEILWYPSCSNVALGLEGAVVKKRSFHGLGFQSKLKQYKDFTPTYHSYTTLEQYFLSIYIDFPGFQIFTKVSGGQFLARDKGVRLEATRYFDNGLRLTGWMTITDANDIMHGEKFFNRGIALEVPFDFFYKCSSKRVWNYAMAAWLRDAGYSTSTGIPLFETLNRERRW